MLQRIYLLEHIYFDTIITIFEHKAIQWSK
jgi:hypothetical protein